MSPQPLRVDVFFALSSCHLPLPRFSRPHPAMPAITVCGVEVILFGTPLPHYAGLSSSAPPLRIEMLGSAPGLHEY